ncbi:MAG: hypothetical protein ABIP93_00815, partial [Gemmatimonadaceae bacterium]
MSLHKLPRIAALASIALAACTADVQRSASSAGDVASVPSSTPATAGVAAEPAAVPASPSAPNAPLAAGDTVAPRLLPGRGKMDATSFAAAIRAGTRKEATWPAGPTPAAGALLPKNRIIAYYGNPHSKKMGVIGEYPEQQMLGMLDKTVAAWKSADPKTPIIPAIHLVTVVAQGAPGSDGMWRRWEDSTMIERTYKWAKSRNGILFLDIQASHSTLQKELPRLLPWLARPEVHLGVDPEFYMHYEREGARPSSKIGMMMASDVNYVIQTLDKLVADK